MIFNQNHIVAQRDAKLKECDATLAELRQENAVKGQLLDHVLHTEHPVFARELITSISSNPNEATSSNSSRSGSPVELINMETSHTSKSKIRQRTAAPSELLFGLKADPDDLSKSQDSNLLHENSIYRIPSVSGSLKLNS